MKYLAPYNTFDIYKLPRWKRWLTYGFLPFYIIAQLSTSFGQLEAFYTQSSPHVQRDFVTLAMYTQLKSGLLKAGVAEKSRLLRIVDNVGEEAYQHGIRSLPENDGEKYIWYYWRYLEPYPLKEDSKKNKQLERLLPQFLEALNELSRLPISNAGLDHKLRYSVLAHMLLDYVKYLDSHPDEMTHRSIYLGMFFSSFRSNIEYLQKKISLSEEESTYAVMGYILNFMYLGTSQDIVCNGGAVALYREYRSSIHAIAPKFSPTAQHKLKNLSQFAETTGIHSLITKNIGKNCLQGGKNE